MIHDISDFIRASVHSLLEHLILGSILASLIVWIFMRNWRAVLIAAVAIPTSIIATFTLMRAMDFSLNNMTLLALTLAVGIVIDDAIIVLENIFRFMEEKGKDRATAAVRGHARNRPGGHGHNAVAGDYFSADRVYERLRPQIREFLRLDDGHGHPGFAAGGFHAHADDEFAAAEGRRQGKRSSTRTASCTHIEEFYLMLLRWSLAHRRIILVIYVLTFASTFGLYHLVGRDWIPADDQAELMSSFTLPEGTSLEKTTQMAQDMAGKVEALPEVAFVEALTHGPTNHAHLFIGLVPRNATQTHSRANGRRGARNSGHLSQYHLQRATAFRAWRRNIFPDCGRDSRTGIDQLAEISKKVANRMRQYPELVDVNPSLNLNTPELQVKLDRQRAADIGVRMTDVSDSVRLFIPAKMKSRASRKAPSNIR